MKIYRVYTHEISNSVFNSTLIHSVLVMAKNEAEALEKVIQRHSNCFHCNDNELQIELVCDNMNEPTILNIEY